MTAARPIGLHEIRVGLNLFHDRVLAKCHDGPDVHVKEISFAVGAEPTLAEVWAKFQPDDPRTGNELADAIRTASMDWQPSDIHRCHHLTCPALVGQDCGCGVPGLLRRLMFALGSLHGMWAEAEGDYAASGSAYDRDRARRERAATLEDVLCVFATVVVGPPDRPR